MEYKYQLILLGTEVPQKKLILKAFLDKINDLKLPESVIKVIEADQIKTDYLGNQPAFVLYFGDSEGNHQQIDLTDRLLKDGTMILPIYFGNDAFSKEIPSILSNQNGIQYKDVEVDRIANIILESFELLRNTRKIFISYKRSESTSIAIQLFEALESYNYDVFLDTHSIGKAEPFQDELWHRMTDCDVIVLLNTPQFLESHWCKEEFAEAGAKKIGIVQLVWPNQNIGKIDTSSHISYPIILKENDFLNNIYNNKDQSKLIERVIEEILQKVESVRARNLASRQDNLITEFRNIAIECGRDVIVQPEKFMTEEREGKKIIYIPTIGVPQSTSCQSAEIRHEYNKNPENTTIRLIYDDLRIRDKWLRHLDWLNDNFKKEIKTLRKQEFKSWLQTTK
ncbi:toll/interleukin-1 receptor domain-containing protein [Empedobacter falsenii]|uniref:Toll/interleukin-1 receptor domain-containing protein n=1 Tax=Empedobacter falsenii TaxID=343874 RepID=A0AAW7DNK9_9FLAO|nr:toll/interleukin-1 receptor domain-containing protein [Empedobacter falsenii]MDM1551851.1 toll/interleukin-1 receptor domain-containing protein [Empedobacter falsenii]